MKKRIIPMFITVLCALVISCGTNGSQTNSSAPAGSSTSYKNVTISENDLVIEEVAYSLETDDRATCVMFKIRNNSGIAIDRIDVTYHILDENGDMLSDGDTWVEYLSAGQGGWTDSNNYYFKDSHTKIGGIKVVALNLDEAIQGGGFTQVGSITISNPTIVDSKNISVKEKR